MLTSIGRMRIFLGGGGYFRGREGKGGWKRDRGREREEKERRKAIGKVKLNGY